MFDEPGKCLTTTNSCVGCGGVVEEVRNEVGAIYTDIYYTDYTNSEISCANVTLRQSSKYIYKYIYTSDNYLS